MNLIGSFNLHVFSYTWWHKHNYPMSICYLLHWALWYCIKEDLRMEELTNNTLVPSRQSLPARTAVWMEARATHIGPDRNKKQKEQTNSLLARTSQTYFSKTPKQIHRAISYFLSCPSTAQSLLSDINKKNFDTKPPPVMDGGIFKEGRRGRKCEGPTTWGAAFCFHSRLKLNLQGQDV